MTPGILQLICDPATHETFEIQSGPDALGHAQESPANLKSGRHYSVGDGIPGFLQEGDLSGLNQKYQSMYDRTALFYDFSTWAYSMRKNAFLLGATFVASPAFYL